MNHVNLQNSQVGPGTPEKCCVAWTRFKSKGVGSRLAEGSAAAALDLGFAVQEVSLEPTEAPSVGTRETPSAPETPHGNSLQVWVGSPDLTRLDQTAL